MNGLTPPLMFCSRSDDPSSTSNINLDDVFADVFFNSNGELLDIDEIDDFGDNTCPKSSMSVDDDASSQVFQGHLFGNALSSIALSDSGDLSTGIYESQGNASRGKSLRTKSSGSISSELTEAQKVERRERNREHAKRSRVRKKFLLESLQQSVNELNHENNCLKESIREHLGPRGDSLIAQCSPEADTLLTDNPSKANRILEDPDYSLVKALQMAQQNFVITDASLPDNPIVYASRGFLTLTGYSLDQILGRNCRFLQGPETDPRAVDKIRNAITKGVDTSVCLLNYRQDGTTFWNLFFVAGLRDSKGNIVNYVGVQSKVSEDYAKLLVNEQNIEYKGVRTSNMLRRK
uniref:Aureochrome1 n=1 Tax=Vaucheria frigida TaxID=195983 RepID=A8QW55_VAUFR|nr:aureochrome1 [Vaucheria frigida]